MSSNMYGFTCTVLWMERHVRVQVVYAGTRDDDWQTLDQATHDWETEDPVLLAKYELSHRDWANPRAPDVRIGLAGTYPHWLETDPSDPKWKPPTPTEKEVLQIIAEGAALDIKHGWDT